MKKSALYIRVSTSHQIDRDSLPFQRQELTNYSKYVLGIDDFEIFEDAGYSAKNTDRPKYQEMMSRIRSKEFTHLLVWKIDRISRNLKDFTEMYDELKECGITFISKNEQFDTSSAMGEAMLKIILVFAELERKITAERVSSIMLSRAEKGLWNGATVPLGYKWSDEVKFPVLDGNEAVTVQYIYDLYEKLTSTSKVAYQLNSEHISTKRNGKWTAKTIGDVLRNPFYIGTYRYNTKNSKRRWKDQKEWVVVENNHTPIISSDQFERVNALITDNYRGNRTIQRENSNTHIFSRLLFCGKCGSSLNAGLDVARKDGYRPSRYTCYANYHLDNYHNCNNFVSDITLLPFILNYISNFLSLQSKVTPRHTPRDIERILLRGTAFIDVEGIDHASLVETYHLFLGNGSGATFNNHVEEEENTLNIEFEKLKKEKVKYEKALARLEDLFLYSDEAMSQKDFLFKKRDISQNIDRINNSLSELHNKSTNLKMTNDTAFINKASHFLITNELTNKKNIDYRELLQTINNDIIRDFIQTLITKIVIMDKKVYSITFQNGITHNFLYKPKENQKIRTKEKFLYLTYQPALVKYLDEYGSISRKELELLTGMTRTSALSLINEFIDRGIIEKRGNSTAIKYFLVDKKVTSEI